MRVHDPVLFPEPAVQLRHVHPRHREEPDSSAVRRVEGREHLDPVILGHETFGPAVPQPAQPRDLALRADGAMKCQRRRDGVVIGRRVGADLFVFPDVLVLLGRGGHERPEFFLLVFPHIQESCADGNQQPLVETGSVVVAPELVAREGEVGVGMGAVDEYLDSAGPREIHQLLHRHDLAGEVGDVGDFDDAGAGGDGGLELIDDILL